jgi:hypothetical protein
MVQAVMPKDVSDTGDLPVDPLESSLLLLARLSFLREKDFTQRSDYDAG